MSQLWGTTEPEEALCTVLIITEDVCSSLLGLNPEPFDPWS